MIAFRTLNFDHQIWFCLKIVVGNPNSMVENIWRFPFRHGGTSKSSIFVGNFPGKPSSYWVPPFSGNLRPWCPISHWVLWIPIPMGLNPSKSYETPLLLIIWCWVISHEIMLANNIYIYNYIYVFIYIPNYYIINNTLYICIYIYTMIAPDYQMHISTVKATPSSYVCWFIKPLTIRSYISA